MTQRYKHHEASGKIPNCFSRCSCAAQRRRKGDVANLDAAKGWNRAQICTNSQGGSIDHNDEPGMILTVESMIKKGLGRGTHGMASLVRPSLRSARDSSQARYCSQEPKGPYGRYVHVLSPSLQYSEYSAAPCSLMESASTGNRVQCWPTMAVCDGMLQGLKPSTTELTS